MSNFERKPPKILTRQETRLLAWQPLPKILLPSTRSRLLRLRASLLTFIPGAWVLGKDPLHTLYDPSHNALCFLFSARQRHLRTRQIEDIRTLETMAVSSRIVHPFPDSTLRGQWRVQGRGPGDSPPLYFKRKLTPEDRSPPYLRV